MSDANTAESPLDAAAEMAGSETTEAFSLLGNETRLAILLALWEELDPFASDDTDHAAGDAIPYSALQESVGRPESEQFNYHLRKLEEEFIERTEDGFELAPAGKQIVQTVIAGSGLDEEEYPMTEIDAQCPNCGAATAITYANDRLYQCCTECDGNYSLGDHHPDAVLNGWRSNPAILSHDSAEAIYNAGRTEAVHQYALRFDGICPTCSGRIEQDLHVCRDHDSEGDQPCSHCHRPFEVAARFVCSVCKAANICSAVELLVVSRLPEVADFLGNHDVVPEYPYVSETSGLETAQTVESMNPLRVQMKLSIDEHDLDLLVDEDLNVIESDA